MGARVGSLIVGALIVGALLVVGAVGCSSSSSDADALRPALDELASVGSPAGGDAFDVAVVGCDDDAEIPAGYASFRFDGAVPADGDALNASIEEVAEWYLPRWEELGWEVDRSRGDARKELDGTAMRAAIDLGKDGGYAIVVVAEDAALCE